jgi:hypothetical protein
LFPHAPGIGRVEAITALPRARFPPRHLTARPTPFLAPATPDRDPAALTAFDAPHVRYANEHPANGTGWLIATGGTAVRLRPASVHALMGGAGTLGMVALLHLAGALGALEAAAVLPGIAATMALTSVAAQGFMRRRLRRAPLLHRLADAPPGATVRLLGTVAAQETVPSLFGRHPAVLCRSRLALADETRGIDFWLNTAAGERLRVHIRGALMLDRPRPLIDPAPGLHEGAREVTLGPGDPVELCGQLHRQADPSGEAAPGRGTPLCWSLRAPRGGFLLVQRQPLRR